MEILVVYRLKTKFLTRSTPLHCRYSTAAIASYTIAYDLEFCQNCANCFMEIFAHLAVKRSRTLEIFRAPTCSTVDKSVLLTLPITLHKTWITRYCFIAS